MDQRPEILQGTSIVEILSQKSCSSHLKTSHLNGFQMVVAAFKLIEASLAVRKAKKIL